MKIVYKKHDEEYIRLDSHLGIDPLADGGGQQVLSPYLAMGCNPAMMIDPLGLQGQTGMSSPGNDHFIMPFGYMVEGTYVYLSADRLGTGKSIGMKRLEAYINNSMMEMAEARQQKIIAVRFAAVLAMVDGYNTALQSLVSSYDIRGMIGSQMRSAYLGEYNNDPNDGGSQPDNTNTKNNEQSLQDSNNPQAPQKGDKYVEGVRIRYVGWIGKGGALTLPGIGIFVGKGVLNPKNGFSDNYFSNLIMHEYGHILQAKQYGNLFYYGRIVPTSFASATWGTVTYGFNSLFGNRNENGYIRHYDHNRTWTEWDASNRAYQYFNYPYWNHNWFPISKP